MHLKFTTAHLEIKLIQDKLIVNSASNQDIFDIAEVKDIGMLDMMNDHKKKLRAWNQARNSAKKVLFSSGIIFVLCYFGFEYSKVLGVIVLIIGLFLFVSGLLLMKKSGPEPKRMSAIRIVTNDGNRDYPFHRSADHSMIVEEFLEKSEAILKFTRQN